MRVQGREPIEGGGERVALVPETTGDLWHLHHVIEPGDRVAGETTRRIQRDDDRMRDTGGQREPMSVTLAAADVEFHEFANRLRVSGEIVACSREDQLGLHHTLNVEAFDGIAVEKEWKPDQRERIEEAAKSGEEPDVAIATVEEGEATIHTVSEYGTTEYASITSPTGKGEFARAREELFGDLGAALARMDVDAVVLAGPGFTKQDALDHITEAHPDLAEMVTTVDTSAAGDRGVHEVLARGALEEVRAETRIAAEAALIDELTGRIRAAEPVVYGPEEVARAAEFGAVEELLILDERLREERAGRGEWPIDADEVIRTVERQGGDVTVFSGEFEPGRQLDSLSGIAALLRYRIE
jgi:protein pelota